MLEIFPYVHVLMRQQAIKYLSDYKSSPAVVDCRCSCDGVGIDRVAHGPRLGGGRDGSAGVGA